MSGGSTARLIGGAVGNTPDEVGGTVVYEFDVQEDCPAPPVKPEAKETSRSVSLWREDALFMLIDSLQVCMCVCVQPHLRLWVTGMCGRDCGFGRCLRARTCVWHACVLQAPIFS